VLVVDDMDSRKQGGLYSGERTEKDLYSVC